jgi:methyl-accepting chemotaxis protein
LPTGYDQLRTDFNAAMENLQNTMEAVAGSTGAVRSGAAEINQASDDLSQRTEQQAASLEETAAALDEITATIRRTAEGAKEARQVVAAAKTDAERSSKVVNETVAAMSAIEISSKEIGNIIGVIDEIAFQTNLLALNAGVEAARAGDAGRGFAVVATEVRGLAQRSAEAAKQIKALIAASSTHVANGVTLVSETGRVLGRTLEQVEELDRLVGEIAASAKEQATGLGQVNTAVNQMDQVTQQNAAMVEQTTAASRSLADEAAELAQLVAEFQTGHAGIEHKTRPSERKPAAAKSRIPADAPEGRFRDAATKPASAAAAVDK